MKIAIVGYGKMGKLIGQLAEDAGHEITFRIGKNNQEEIVNIHANNTDVAIEFSTPETAYDNLKTLVQNKVHIVCGTTGWLHHLQEIHELVYQMDSGFIYASNFSIGVNLFFELNQTLSKIMANHPSYTPHIHEIHHTSKQDAPSGTAISLAEHIINADPRYAAWTQNEEDKNEKVYIESSRIDPAPGTHGISYSSEIDTIEIKHTAHSRLGFAKGALLAASYVADRQGIFTMKDVLGL